MIADLQCVVLDCPAPAELAAFYHELLGGRIDHPDPRWSLDENWSTLHTPSGLVLCFQAVPDHRPPTWPDPTRPQQFHLDLGVRDLDEAQTQVLALGAKLLDAGSPNHSWRVFADPAGHPLCLVRHHGD
ncbi:VOC family protein [Streptomyces acidiscabies]|uniref:VOC family protein n=1 Tax=Streptomyces acidiscabies TaxID=42234 RepID=A0AAP6EEV2_9ACTN|nr:VOC family protein [Streptomyces acidiscabies]MBP5939455.1 VOC family protein [Streptomyces sp. LBUM 1476]MBZ3910600.1 VOC family protein [Streptomyces acidiscabies]MDX2959600.1 VOC family protein [Streptomyces acidiscabies]MDX3019112.1 VOC family protein [Streptomyces acidiscabies]MDX3790807.1 VOC family protein [Streptomyces acidiscabies]